jgi:hypothetical protein
VPFLWFVLIHASFPHPLARPGFPESHDSRVAATSISTGEATITTIIPDRCSCRKPNDWKNQMISWYDSM